MRLCMEDVGDICEEGDRFLSAARGEMHDDNVLFRTGQRQGASIRTAGSRVTVHPQNGFLFCADSPSHHGQQKLGYAWDFSSQRASV